MEAELRALVVAASGLPPSQVNWGVDPNGRRAAYITIHLISQRGGRTMQGPDGLYTGRVQVDCYAPDFAGSRRLGQDLLAALDGHRDRTFRAIFFDAMRTSREGGAGRDAGENDGEAIYRRSMDFITHWRASDAG